jgi:hypothetical protein
MARVKLRPAPLCYVNSVPDRNKSIKPPVRDLGPGGLNRGIRRYQTPAKPALVAATLHQVLAYADARQRDQVVSGSTSPKLMPS